MRWRGSRLVAPLLVLAAGAALRLPELGFVPRLATGDHGRDLYAAWRTLEGDVPLRDYWWNYGPLMPYYYAAFLDLLGVRIRSVQLGAALLEIAAGLAVYAIAARLAGPALALLAALWFASANPDFFHTWNHVAAVLAMLVCVACLVARLGDPRSRSARWLPAAVLLALLVKPNVGAALALASSLGLALVDRARPVAGRRAWRLHAAVLIGAPGLVAAIYAVLIRGLPRDYVLQCLPWAPGYDPPAPGSAPSALLGFAVTRLSDPGGFLPWDAAPLEAWSHRVLAGVVATCAAVVAIRWRRIGTGREAGETILVLGLLALFALCALHEFWLSGTVYRLFWGTPLVFPFAFLIVALALRGAAPRTRGALYALLLAGVLLDAFGEHRQRQALRADPGRRLSLPGARVVVGNDADWVRVVEGATRDLERRLAPGETFLALPYDPLYHYLTRRPSPVRESIFFDYVNVSDAQQRAVIERLERRGVDTVLISNRVASDEAGLGVLGASYGERLAAYLARHFEPISTHGDWRRPGGWAERHAVRILRRRPRRAGADDARVPDVL